MSNTFVESSSYQDLPFPEFGKDMTTSTSPTKLLYIKSHNENRAKITFATIEDFCESLAIKISRCIFSGKNESRQVLLELQKVEDGVTAVTEFNKQKDEYKFTVQYVGLTSLAAYVKEWFLYDYSDRSYKPSKSCKQPTDETSSTRDRTSSSPGSRYMVPSGQSNYSMNSSDPKGPSMFSSSPESSNVVPTGQNSRNPSDPRMNTGPKQTNNHNIIPTTPNGPVVEVHGVKRGKFSVHNMFRLFMQYGDVLYVMFLDEEQRMLVQMTNPEFATNVVKFLGKIRLFDCNLEVKLSSETCLCWNNQKYISDGKCNHPSNFDYTNYNWTERFIPRSPIMTKPSKYVMFYNAPANFQVNYETNMNKICENEGVKKPVKSVIILNFSETSSSGLFEFSDVNEAVEFIAKCNYYTLYFSHPKRLLLRLCFSDRTIPAAGNNMKITRIGD